jgi:hypothetical protein
MKHLLPVIYRMCVLLFADSSEASVQIQKQILKVFYSLIQYYLPLGLISRPVFTDWMQLAWQILERPVPQSCMDVSEDDRAELIWWKCKKWSMHIMTRCFHRYGNPGKTEQEYNEFSNWFLHTFSEGIIHAMLRILEQYCNKQYLPRRLLQMVLNCITMGVTHSISWKVIQPHVQLLVQGVIFPLLCHTDEDEQLWHSDPVEYIRVKFDVYEEFFNPSTAAQSFLHDASLKRVVVLHTAMGFLGHVLTPDLGPSQKSGALHMLGALAEVILKKKKLPYKEQAEMILVNYVFPEFSSKHGFLRAKACWVVQNFSELKFKDLSNLTMAVNSIRYILHVDLEIPVKVEAAIGLQMFLKNHDEAKELLKPYIQNIIGDLLQLIRDTENDDLTCALQRIVCTFSDDIAPLAVEVTKHLAQTFVRILESTTDGSDDKSLTVMGVLNTLETICSVMEDHDEVLPQIENVVLEVVGVIIHQSLLEFIEEMLSLIYSLTTRQISHRMWLLLPHIYQLFNDGNSDFFIDMMPTFFNYITVDPMAFLSNPSYMEMIFNMCRMVILSDELTEDAESHAAKLFEVLLIQYKGLIDHAVLPIVNVVVTRMQRDISTRSLRTMCLQVIIASVVYNPPSVIAYLDHPLPNTSTTLLTEIVSQWLANASLLVGLHERKLFIIGLCTLLYTADKRPPVLNTHTQYLLPTAIFVLKNLRRTFDLRSRPYQLASKLDDETCEEHEVGDEDDVVDGPSDKQQYSYDGGDCDDDVQDDCEETVFESFETELDKVDDPIHEYKMFRGVLLHLCAKDSAWYHMLMSHLNEDYKKDLDMILHLAADPKRTSQVSGNSCLAALLSAPVI